MQLYEQHFDRLVRVAYLVSGRADLAEEVVQEAFVRAHRSWTTVRDPLPYLAAYLAELAPPPVSAPLALPMTVAGPPTRVGTSAGGTAEVPWASEDNGESEEPLASGSVSLRNAGDASTPAWVVVGATTASLDGDAVTLEDVHSDGERLVFTVVGPPPETGQSLSVRVGVDGEFVIAGRHEIPGARSPVWGDLVDPAPDGRAIVEVAVEPGDTVDILVRGSNPDSSFLSVTHMAFVVPAPDPAEAPPTTPGQPPDAPQTTVGGGSTAPPTSPPAASDPADGIATTAVEGTFLGNEVFTPTDGGCPDLDHVLVSTFTLTDGTTWDLDAEYCGDLDGSAWSGGGTFTFTTPESDTLHGTFESAVTVISEGEPTSWTSPAAPVGTRAPRGRASSTTTSPSRVATPRSRAARSRARSARRRPGDARRGRPRRQLAVTRRAKATARSLIRSLS